jgi:arsenate reductase-like glutaredoxin family protein
VEAWLSQYDVPFTMRDVVQDPITPEELSKLVRDREGRIRVPFSQVGKSGVLGFDPLRLQEYLDEDPTSRVVAYVRKGEPSSEQLLAHLKAKNIKHEVRDVDTNPPTDQELWDLLTIPGRNLRTPYTLIGDELIFGYDIPKLARLLGIKEEATPAAR